MPSRILVTGASGFVGTHLCRCLATKGYRVRAVSRSGYGAHLDQQQESLVVGDIGPETDWQDALSGVDAVVHLAARVHIMNETSQDALAEFRKVNVAGSLNLARQAAKAGVKRFIYLSSIKVNGERTQGRTFTAEDKPAPQDPYAQSKAEAESQLLRLAQETAMEIVIIRPPLVYGPGVKANFLRMVNWVKKGYPLPLGAINNRRSLVSVYNLVDLVATCIEHPKAANQIFLVSDGESISTKLLINRLAESLNKRACLIPFPRTLLLMMGSLLGQGEAVQRLCEDLEVDIDKTSTMLDWSPPYTMRETLQQMCEQGIN